MWHLRGKKKTKTGRRKASVAGHEQGIFSKSMTYIRVEKCLYRACKMAQWVETTANPEFNPWDPHNKKRD